VTYPLVLKHASRSLSVVVAFVRERLLRTVTLNVNGFDKHQFNTIRPLYAGMLKSRDRSWSRDASRPIFDGLGLVLGLEGFGLVNIPGCMPSDHIEAWRHAATYPGVAESHA